MPIPSVTLGRGAGGVTATVIGFGAMGLDAFQGPPLPRSESLAVLKAAYDAGVRHFDTAELYRSGQFGQPVNAETVYNEETVGAFLKTIDRASVSVATKYFPLFHADAADAGVIRATFDEQLRRLDTPYVDIYYLHRMISKDKGDLIKWLAAVKPYVAAGKIRAVGLSEVPPAWLPDAHAVVPIAAVQHEWSLVTRGLEADVIPAAKALGIAVVAYSPLGRGLATLSRAATADAHAGIATHIPRFAADALAANVKATQAVADVAARHGATTAQVSLAWLLAKAKQLGVTVVAIPGTRNVERAAANSAAAALVLSKEDLDALEHVADAVVGARGSDQYMAVSYENTA